MHRNGSKPNASGGAPAAVVARWLALAVAGGALLFALAGCATNPVTGKREFSLVSPAQELEMGREGHQAVLEEYGVYDDPKLAAYVDSVGQALAKVSQLPNLQWHFTVIDDPVVNAFALPGGYIYITRGILAHLNSEAQLAGVLGHEIGHVTARHSAARATQQQLAGLGLGLASVFSQTFQKYSDVAQQALGLMLLKYSRDNETQADELGVGYATAAGWDPREIPATYHMLGRVSDREGQRLPGFLSTHPDPGNREVRTRELATRAAQGKSGLQVRGRSFLQRTNDVVYGVDPRAGYFENGRFYHPGLDFELAFPSGWQTQNAHTSVAAMQPQQRATMQLTIVTTHGTAPTDYVQELAAKGAIAGSRGRAETIGGFGAWVGRLTVKNSDGSEGSLLAAFIQRSAEETFQFLARNAAAGDEDEAAIVQSVRSFRSLADPARRNPKPDRVLLVPVAQPGPCSEVIAKLGAQAIDPEETSIINNLGLDENVLKGQLIKVVRPGSRK